MDIGCFLYLQNLWEGDWELRIESWELRNKCWELRMRKCEVSADIKSGRMCISLADSHSFRLKNKGLDSKKDMLVMNKLVR